MHHQHWFTTPAGFLDLVLEIEVPSLAAAFAEQGKGCVLFAAWSYSVAGRTGAAIAADMRALKHTCFFLAATQPGLGGLVETGVALDYAGRAFERARPASTQRTGKPEHPVLQDPRGMWERLLKFQRDTADLVRAAGPQLTPELAARLEAALWFSLGTGLLSGCRFTTMVAGLEVSRSAECHHPGCRYRHCPGNRILLPDDGGRLHVVLPHHKTAETRQFRPIEFFLEEETLGYLLEVWETQGREVGWCVVVVVAVAAEVVVAVAAAVAAVVVVAIVADSWLISLCCRSCTVPPPPAPRPSSFCTTRTRGAWWAPAPISATCSSDSAGRSLGWMACVRGRCAATGPP